MKYSVYNENKYNATIHKNDNKLDVKVGNSYNKKHVPGTVFEYGVTAVNGKSGSTGNAAWLQVEAGDQTSKLEFQNSAASVETFTVTLTEETTVYFYRVDGKTVNVYDIAITNKA